MEVNDLKQLCSRLFDVAGTPINTEEPEYSVIGDLPEVTSEWMNALTTAKETLQLPYDLRPFQEQTARSLYHGKDVILLR